MQDDSKKLGSGHSSGSVYQVQIRVKDSWPSFSVGGMIVDQVWSDLRLSPAKLPVGVPTPPIDMGNIEYGVPFPQAEAHRWWVICLVESVRPCSPIETRIMERKVERTWAAYEVGVLTKPPMFVGDEHNIWADKPEPEKKAAA